MKKLFLALLPLLIGTSAFAQDLITTRTGEDIKGRVTEIGLTEVKYHPWESAEGTVSTISKANILLIRYEDGGKEIFEAVAAPVPDILPERAAVNKTGVVSSLNNSSMFMRGQVDAKRYYQGYRESGTISLIGTLFLGPVFGLIMPIAIASTPPKMTTLNYPSETSMRNPEYARGYVAQAQKIRNDKVWLNYGIGAGIPIAIILIVLGGILLSY